MAKLSSRERQRIMDVAAKVRTAISDRDTEEYDCVFTVGVSFTPQEISKGFPDKVTREVSTIQSVTSAKFVKKAQSQTIEVNFV